MWSVWSRRALCQSLLVLFAIEPTQIGSPEQTDYQHKVELVREGD